MDLLGKELIHAIPFAVLGASLMGSGHCVAMCGGLILMVGRDRKGIVFYHLGRLAGYSSLGCLAGFLGSSFLKSSDYTVFSWIASVSLGFGFTFIGTRLWVGKSLHLFRLPNQVLQKVSRVGPGATGFLSVFLPCGWLHTFVLGAVATGSALLGALYLAVFWMGTLPALSAGPLAFSRVFQPMARRWPRFSALILISIGVGTIGLKMLPLGGDSSKTQSHHCHMKQDAVGK